MGTNSALLARKVVDNAFQVVAIHFMTIIQAIDYLNLSDKLSSVSKKTYDDLREIVPVFKNDHIKYKEIEGVISYLHSNDAFEL
jgi:histidine ammonia-lyase